MTVLSVPDPYPLVALVGPTASGKSALAMMLSLPLGGEIVNYDSVQVYKYFDIGTAKPTSEERARVPHHLVDFLEPWETFTAGEYARRARTVLKDIRDRQRLPILVGGTGLYLRALLEGLFEGPQRDEELRHRLRKIARKKGAPYLHRLLTKRDPQAAVRIAPQDSHRLIRALEIYLSTQTPQSEFFQKPRQSLGGFKVIRIGLNPQRKQLYTRINDRVSFMFRRGLQEEAKALLNRGTDISVKPFQSLGYKQILKLLNGTLTQVEALAEAQQATRHYAKRQMTWFRRETPVTWFEGFGDEPAIQQQVLSFLISTKIKQEIIGGGCCGK